MHFNSSMEKRLLRNRQPSVVSAALIASKYINSMWLAAATETPPCL